MSDESANQKQEPRNTIPTRIAFDHYWFQLVRLLPTHHEKLNFLLDMLTNEFDPTLGWAQTVVRERLLKNASNRIRRMEPSAITSPPQHPNT